MGARVFAFIIIATGVQVLPVTASYIYSQLAAGDTVKLGVTGHAEDVIGAGMVLGVPWLILDSDRAQTDVDPTDNNLGANPAIFVWDVNNTLYGEPAGTVAINDISMQVVPEPSSTAMLACGFAGAGLLLGMRRRCVV